MRKARMTVMTDDSLTIIGKLSTGVLNGSLKIFSESLKRQFSQSSGASTVHCTCYKNIKQKKREMFIISVYLIRRVMQLVCLNPRDPNLHIP